MEIYIRRRFLQLLGIQVSRIYKEGTDGAVAVLYDMMNTRLISNKNISWMRYRYVKFWIGAEGDGQRYSMKKVREVQNGMNRR